MLICSILLFVLFRLGSGQEYHEYRFSEVAIKVPDDSGRRSIRHGWISVAHLFENDLVQASFCLEQRSIFVINDITYSNDGDADTVSVYLDGVPMGSFTGHSTSDWGKMWDQPMKAPINGRTGMLDPGKHDIVVKVDKSKDCHGIELWSMNVTVYIAVNTNDFWCDSNYKLAPRKWECLSDSDREGGTPAPPPSTTSPPTTTTTTIPSTTTEPPNHVAVSQRSFYSGCLDKKNINVAFTAQLLAGTTITLKQVNTDSSAPAAADTERNNLDAHFCDSDIFQIGDIDKDNKELASIYQGTTLKVNITDVKHPERVFPAKLLPFVTTDISLYFKMPPNIQMEKGSAYLLLGLFNLTKPAHIGLRYFDHTANAFTEFHFMTFTPQYQAMGWSIPSMADTPFLQNVFHLQFQTEANVIMFDFLKLQYSKRDERKLNTVIARKNHWKIRGLRYNDSTGMSVFVDGLLGAQDMEDVLLLYQVGSFKHYETVVRIHQNGMIYPYKTYPTNISDTERLRIDVSGFFVSPESNNSVVAPQSPVRSLYIDTSIDEVTMLYEDGSAFHFSVLVSPSSTQLQVVRYDSGRNIGQQSLVFTSTKVNKEYAAVDTLATPSVSKGVFENLEELSGQHSFTFTRYKQGGLFYANNHINVQFPK